MNIKILDNILSPYLFDTLKDRVMASQISWFYGNTTYKTGHEDSLWGYSFEHLLADNGYKNSPLYDTFEPILSSIVSEHDQKPLQFLRMRLGMITATPDRIIHKPHVDYDFNQKVGLLYFNDTNAPTFFYDKKYDVSLGLSIQDYYEKEKDNFSKVQEVECISNRLVLFDGLIYHASSTPTNYNRRIVLSFNYV